MSQGACCYRIYTEDIHRHTILKEATERFAEGFTVLNGQGCWNGEQEPCLIIEIIRDVLAEPMVKELAEVIKRLNEENCLTQ